MKIEKFLGESSTTWLEDVLVEGERKEKRRFAAEKPHDKGLIIIDYTPVS